MIIQIYSLLFYLWWLYGVANGGNNPLATVAAILTPVPLVLRAWGIV